MTNYSNNAKVKPWFVQLSVLTVNLLYGTHKTITHS